jgi:hypothetical protein
LDTLDVSFRIVYDQVLLLLLLLLLLHALEVRFRLSNPECVVASWQLVNRMLAVAAPACINNAASVLLSWRYCCNMLLLGCCHDKPQI